MGIIPKTSGISMKVRISKNPDVMRLELMKGGAVRMQDGGKLPPGVKRAVERAQTSKSVVPIQASDRLARRCKASLGLIHGIASWTPRLSRWRLLTVAVNLDRKSVV